VKLAASGAGATAPVAKPKHTQISSSGSQPPATSANQPQPNQPNTPPPGPTPKEIRDAHDRYANLQSRADAALSNLQQLRSQQQAQGMDLRGDVLGNMSRMQTDLSESQRYLSQNDLAAAGEYMDRADREIAALEKFLGR
jgi:serine/threonine-protein kinase